MHRASELLDRLDPSLNEPITELLTRSCELRDGQACLELAVHCGRLTEDVACLKVILRRLDTKEREECGASGDPDCVARGVYRLYDHGMNVAITACLHDLPRSCFLLGYAFEAGYHEMHPNIAEALTYYRRGCETGDADSCESLAVRLRRDHPDRASAVTEADAADARAIVLRAAACEEGDALACMTLSRAYLDGAGVPADPDRAAKLRATACELHLDDRPCGPQP